MYYMCSVALRHTVYRDVPCLYLDVVNLLLTNQSSDLSSTFNKSSNEKQQYADEIYRVPTVYRVCVCPPAMIRYFGCSLDAQARRSNFYSLYFIG